MVELLVIRRGTPDRTTAGFTFREDDVAAGQLTTLLLHAPLGVVSGVP
jgi:hypothetical protein